MKEYGMSDTTYTHTSEPYHMNAPRSTYHYKLDTRNSYPVHYDSMSRHSQVGHPSYHSLDTAYSGEKDRYASIETRNY